MARGIEYFTSLDQSFAKLFVTSEDKAFPLLCFAFAAARAGHLCIQVGQDLLLPKPFFLTKEEEEQRTLQAQCEEGLSSLSSSLCSHIEDPKTVITTPFCLYRQCFYFQKHWALEREYMGHLCRLQNQMLPKLFLHERVEPVLYKEQLSAIEKALTFPVSLLSGGPGTGKTFTAITIIQVLLARLSEQDKKSIRIILTAPTGKAASLLESKVQERLGRISGLVCGTLHSFLQEGQSLFADLILIDESSMIDAKVLVRFLSLLRGGRIVFMGDKDQLPPVEIGGFFPDTIALASSLSLPVTLLTQGQRTQDDALKNIFQAILKGDLLSLRSFPCVKIFPWEESQKLQKEALQEFYSFFSFLDEEIVWSKKEESLCKLSTFCILSALKKGPLGSTEINARIQDLRLQGCSQDKMVCPILILTNDTKTGLMNGDVGLVWAKGSSWRAGSFTGQDLAYFPKQGELPAILLPPFSLGYALSIHKSQGSEYDSVWMVLPPGSERLGREVLYTGATRAKKNLQLFIEEGTFPHLLTNSSQKLTGLSARFKE